MSLDLLLPAGGGAAAFVDLTDVPGTITPNGVVIGNADGTALVMVTGETQQVAPLASGIVAVDCSLGSFFTVTMDQDVASFAFTNVPDAGTVYYFVLEIAGNGNTLAWVFTGGTVQWSDGVVGVPPQGSHKNAYIFYTYDAGTTWLGTIIGENYVAG